MRTLIFFFIFAICTEAQMASAGGIESSGVMHNLDLRNCLQKKCIQMRALKAESGNFTPLMSLNEITVDFYSNGKKSTYEGRSGYIDYERNVVLLKTGSHHEILFGLSDMTIKNYDL